MGLFDGLIGGNNSNQTNETPVVTPEVATDPILVMNEQATSTPPEVDAFLSMSAGDVTADMPSYTDRKAHGEEVATTNLLGQEEKTELVEPDSPMLDLFASSDVVAVNVAENVTTETPVEVKTEETPVEVVSTENSSLFNLDNSENNLDFSAKTEETPVEAKTEEVSTEEKLVTFETPEIEAIAKEETPELFSFGAEESEEKVEAQTEENFSENEVSTNIFEEKAETKTEAFSSTADFIAMSLSNLDAMEEKILARKNAYLEKAWEYKSQKEKFAELEAEAIKDSASMDDEQAKITTMRNYFQKQQKQESEITDSVNTALAGIATQKAVGNAMKTPKTRTSKKAVTA